MRYCTHCGTAFTTPAWPLKCGGCGQLTYRNPIPVAVGIIPVEDYGLLIIRRGQPPKVGEWAFPGGFIEFDESFEQAVIREVLEETGIGVKSVTPTHTRVTKESRLLIFGMTDPVTMQDLWKFRPNPEVTGIDVMREPRELCFPTHTEAAHLFRRT